MFFKAILLLIIVGFIFACSDDVSTSPEGELIPRSMYEKAQYYLISVEPDGNFLKTLHSRVSSMSHGYSVTRIDCKNQRYQSLGYGEDKRSNIKMYNKVQWTEILFPGSSKSDLVTFVCTQSKK